jgi:hypothetical protein
MEKEEINGKFRSERNTKEGLKGQRMLAQALWAAIC